MTLLLLIACTTGELRFEGEDIQLRSGWVFQDPDTKQTGILLSNNHLPCELSGEEDPTEVILDTQSLNHAYTREGSVLLWLEVHPTDITLQAALKVSAYFHHVQEAELMWEKGLTAAYRATETETQTLEGELFLEDIHNDQWRGHITLGADAITGDFRSQLCKSDDLSQILGLYGIN